MEGGAEQVALGIENDAGNWVRPIHRVDVEGVQ